MAFAMTQDALLGTAARPRPVVASSSRRGVLPVGGARAGVRGAPLGKAKIGARCVR